MFNISEPLVCEPGWEKFQDSCYLFSASYGNWNSGKVQINITLLTTYLYAYFIQIMGYDILVYKYPGIFRI